MSVSQTPARKPVPPLDPRIILLYRMLAGEMANRYIEEFLLVHVRKVLKRPELQEDDLREALEDPYTCLRIFFGHYGFARRGKDRDDLAHAALEALDKLKAEQDFEVTLQQESGTRLWELFDEACTKRGRKSNEAQNRGLVQGMLELAQEIYTLDKVGSIAAWLCDGIEAEGHLEPQFLRIVDIRGVGPKSTSTFIRDSVYLFGMEDTVDPADRIYIQPVDRWLRAITKYAVPEPDMESAADWIVAGKISKYARRARVSGIRFNMGCTYFGQKLVREPDRFEAELKKALAEEVERSKPKPPQED